MNSKPTKLAIFDVDGTLTDTNFVDGISCIRSTAQLMGQDSINTDLKHYQEITHSAIASQLWQEEFQREIEAEELVRLEAGHLAIVLEMFERDPSRFCEIPGAGAMLASLTANPDWSWAIATGSWKASTLFKLANSGLVATGAHPLDVVAMATASNTFRRFDIVDLAHQLAREALGIEKFSHVVFVGDGTWDAKAAQHLELPFVGRQDVKAAAEKLIELGAKAVVPDYQNLDAFMAVLERS